RLARGAAAPHRAHGVDDPAGGQVVAPGRLGVAGVAAAEGAALGQQAGPGGPVDGAVDAAAAEQRAVGGVHDRVDLEGRDVAGDDLDARVRVHPGDPLHICCGYERIPPM